MIDRKMYIYEFTPGNIKTMPISTLKILKETGLIEGPFIKNGLVRIISKEYGILKDIVHIINGRGYDPNKSIIPSKKY